jgi:hypothetical protein
MLVLFIYCNCGCFEIILVLLLQNPYVAVWEVSSW